MEQSSLISNAAIEALAAQTIQRQVQRIGARDVLATIQSYEALEEWDAMSASEQVVVQALVLKAVHEAAGLEDWAVSMGFQRLTPGQGEIDVHGTVGGGTQNEQDIVIIRVMLGFAPSMTDEDRLGFTEELGKMINGELFE